MIRGPYFHELLEQPAALKSIHAALAATPSPSQLAEALNGGGISRIVLTGMGSSLHALYPLHLALSRRNIPSHWIETSELLLGFDSLYARETLLVAVSQSGESAEIVTLMRRASEFGQVIAVTNNSGSTLGRSASSVLSIHAGSETTVSCKSYLNTVAALYWLSVLLMNGDRDSALADLERTERAVREYLDRWSDHFAEMLSLSADINGVFVIGRAESMATAGTGALILKESTRRHAEGMSCAAFRHGPLEMASRSELVIVLEGDERTAALNRRLLEDVNQSGGRAVLVTAAEGGGAAGPAYQLQIVKVPAALRPVVEILPIQMLSLALAAHDGREAGRFERATKITSVE